VDELCACKHAEKELITETQLNWCQEGTMKKDSEKRVTNHKKSKEWGQRDRGGLADKSTHYLRTDAIRMPARLRTIAELENEGREVFANPL